MMANYQSRYTGPEIDRRLGLMVGNFLHIKWSAEMPVTEMLDEPADYIGIYAGEEQDPPADPTRYKWYFYKGSKGDTGEKGDQGDPGTGNNWFVGTAITGTSTTPIAYPTDIANALVGDIYMNSGALPDTGRAYVCSVGGDASTARWAYSHSLRGADGTGIGDMLASEYADSSGVVKDSAKLGGQLPSFYLAVEDLFEQILNGVTQSETLTSISATDSIAAAFGKIMKMYASGAAGLLSKSTVAEVKTALDIGKTIYSGTLSVSGNANIPEINNYTLYSVFVSGAGTAIGIRTGALINFLIMFAYQGNQYIDVGTIDISGTTCTFSLFNQIAHNAGSNHSAATTSGTITSIAGIV